MFTRSAVPMLARGESGFGYKARLVTQMKRDDDYMWTIVIKDNPNNPDWAAWTALTQLSKFNPAKYPEDDEYFAVDGVIT